MQYCNVKRGIFLSRPNRFIAEVEIDGKREICHVKNTGRCRELLVPGATVILERSEVGTRKTAYDLVAVYKGSLLINMDSQAPNRVFGEWAGETDFFGRVSLLKPEYTYLHSRFDFYLEAEGRQILVEVKGVTLERDGVLLFPDAPTERGVRHLRELTQAVAAGLEAHVFFILQVEDCRYFTPNAETHPAFAQALREAKAGGVGIHAFTCTVKEDALFIKDEVPVVL